MQVHTVDQTAHAPIKHSFVSQSLLVGRWPPTHTYTPHMKNNPTVSLSGLHLDVHDHAPVVSM